MRVTDCPTCHQAIVTELAQNGKLEIVCQKGHYTEVSNITRTADGATYQVKEGK